MTSALAVTIEIFDPPMCCFTGLCGPSVAGEEVALA